MEPTIEEMLDVCLEKVKGDAHDFIESLNEFYEENERLTEKQKQALQKFYWNCVD